MVAKDQNVRQPSIQMSFEGAQVVVQMHTWTFVWPAKGERLDWCSETQIQSQPLVSASDLLIKSARRESSNNSPRAKAPAIRWGVQMFSSRKAS